MSLEDYNFAVARDGKTYRMTGEQIKAKNIQENDIFFFQRGDKRYKFVVQSDLTATGVKDEDLFAATDPTGKTYKVTGAQFKTLFDALPLEQCSAIVALTYRDCLGGCGDSEYCQGQCVRIFHEQLQSDCGNLPEWYSPDMPPELVIYLIMNPPG